MFNRKRIGSSRNYKEYEEQKGMKFTKEQNKVMLEELSLNGFNKQCDIAIRDLDRLTQALIDYRKNSEYIEYENICKRLADVMIVAEQVAMSVGEDVVAYYINKTLKVR
jgi:hypothetical protein